MHRQDKMGLSRHEVNLRRLLVKCELMMKNNQKDDQRFPKYISSLTDMLMQLKETEDSENINDYYRRIKTLKKQVFDENSDSENDILPSKNNANRAELLGTNSLRSRKGKGTDDLDDMIKYHQDMQDKLADNMLKLTRNLKEQSQLANKIIKQDTEVAQKSSTLTERNFSKLKVESEKLAEHSRRACKCWMWVMLIIVMVLFIKLQMLLGFAGRNKSGRKTELQQRALELLRVRSTPVYLKIRELYRSIQQSGALTNSGAVGQQAAVASKDLQSPPALTPNMPQPASNIPRVHPFNTTADNRQLAPVIHNKPRSTTMYNQQSIYQYAPQQYTTAKPAINSTYPVHPDVRFKRLPFFDVLADLIKPSSLVPQNTQRMQDHTFFFHLTPAQASDIASNRDLRPDSKLEYSKQVQLRFCLLETSCEQEDYFPPNIAVKVNNKMCPLPNPIPTNKPGVDPKRPPRPVNITPMIKLNPTIANTITVSWAAEYGRGYVMSVMLVHKLNSAELLQRLKQRGIKHSDYTRGVIKEKLSEDADCEIATTSLRVSLMCPLGKMRMTTPCRATTCQHLQCFDASLFLQMNERKPTWNCPVCDKPALYDHLVIDGYFQDVLASSNLPNDTNEIQLHKDGSWSTQMVVKKEATVKPEDLDESVQIIDDDVIPVIPDDKSSVKVITSSNEGPKNSTVVDLTLSDSEDEQPAKRKTPPKPDSTNTFNVSAPSKKRKRQHIQSVSSSVSIIPLSSTSGSSSVSSSGYRSPSVITLDSPSPPNSPQRQQPLTPVRSSCMMQSNGMSYQPSSSTNLNYGAMPFLEIDDSNSANSFFPQF